MTPLLYRLRALFQTFQSHEHVFSLSVAFVIGIVSGLTAVVLRLLIESIQWLGDFLPTWSLELIGTATVGVILIPAAGGLVVGPIITRFAPEAKGHGVPEVMAAILTKGGFIRPRVAWIKAIASAITIGSGGSAGREGPIIQIGSSVGSTLGYMLHLPPRLMRTFVACGSAGGIAAAFNAPIAGALFAVEVILGDFGFVQLAPIVTSSVMATVVARGVEGDFSAFVVPKHSLLHPVELIPYVVLGLGCGLGAVGFIHLLDKMEDVFDERVPLPEWLKPALGGLFVGLIGFKLPEVFGMGYGAIDSALHGQIALWLLIVMFGAKLMTTTLTLASGGSGGIFAPSLFMGAMIGGTVGYVADWAMPGMAASSGAYALVGMAAMVGAATHAPLTGIVIIFELTNDYKIILPLMISTIIGVLTASALTRESIYTQKLRRQGIDYDTGPETNVLRGIHVRHIMRSQFEQVPVGLPFNFLVDQLLQTARSHLPVVDDNGRLVGVVPREVGHRYVQLRDALSESAVAYDVANRRHAVLLPGDTLDQALMRFNETGLRELYVMDDLVRRQLVGMVRKGDLMDAYQQELVKRATGDTFAYSLNRPHSVETVKVMDGYGILEIESPHDFSGKLLRELDLRNRFGVNVLAIKRPSPSDEGAHVRVWVPESSDRLEDGDVLVVLGRNEHINNLHRLW